MELKYLIAGSGATGGSLGAFLASVGKDVTFLARGAHLAALKESGMRLKNTRKGDFTVQPVKASSMDDYNGTPDVVFVCVKSYSLDDVTALLSRIGNEETVVIPLLNIFTVGGQLQKALPSMTVTDGTIYVNAGLTAPGEITHYGAIFRVVYGLRPEQKPNATILKKLDQVKMDLDEAGISGEYSSDIRRDAFEKFMFTSPMAAAGEYYHAQGGDFQKPGEPRAAFIAMNRELLALAEAMGLTIPTDMVEKNLSIMDNLSPQSGTSMQRDIAKGHQSEISALVYAVEDLAKDHGVDMPTYSRIIAELKARGLR